MQIEQIPEEQSIFEEFYERSSTGKRLANYLIDLVLFYVLLFLLGFILALLSPTGGQKPWWLTRKIRLLYQNHLFRIYHISVNI